MSNPQRKKLFSVANLLILLGVLFLLLSFGPLVIQEIWYFFKEVRNQDYSLNAKEDSKESVFGRIITNNPIKIVPVNKDFSIVIEKIGVNAPIVRDVSIVDENAYKQALKSGVAHAISSDYPSESPSNVYLFAHASLNFWDLGKYATVFNLLRKLNYKDKIHVFYV